jgi:hypothetical protein
MIELKTLIQDATACFSALIPYRLIFIEQLLSADALENPGRVPVIRRLGLSVIM